MALLDLLGRRWTLRLLWELRSGPLGFRALQEACGGISPTAVSTRLGELRAAGLVGDAPARAHGLTELGRELLASLGPLLLFSEAWGERLSGRGPARTRGA
jgi:DNA-binding HxlR family transcriptional regulator